MPFENKNIDVSRTLERFEVAKSIMEVVYGLIEIEDYSKEAAANELLEFLNDNGYLNEIVTYKGEKK